MKKTLGLLGLLGMLAIGSLGMNNVSKGNNKVASVSQSETIMNLNNQEIRRELKKDQRRERLSVNEDSSMKTIIDLDSQERRRLLDKRKDQRNQNRTV